MMTTGRWGSNNETMKKLNLLFLEDEEMDVFLIRKVLERSGLDFDLVATTNKIEFLEQIAIGNFDVILADHSLPQFSAMDALQVVKQKNISKPFILVTGTVSEDFAVNAMKDGAWDYILKDRLQRLPAAIVSAMEKYYLEEERKEFLEELITKKTMMNEAERLAHFGSWQVDFETGVIYWSDEQFRILGYKPGSITPSINYLLDRIHVEDRDYVASIVTDRDPALNTQNFECRIVCNRGTLKYVTVELAFVKNDKNENIRANGFMYDVTASKDAERKLVESEQKYRHLFENCPVPMWVMSNTTLNFLDVNNAAIRHYGYSKEEFLSMSTVDIRPDEEKSRFINLDRAVHRGFNNNGTWKHLKKDGTIIFAEISTDQIHFEGDVARMVLVNDVTEKIKAENKLRQSEAQLKASQRIAHIGSWEASMTSGENTPPDRWSDETYRIFGLTPGEIEIGKDVFYGLVHPEDREKVTNAVKNAIDNNEEYNLEHRIVRKDGETRYVHERGEIIRDPETGLPVKIEGTVQDITKRKEDEELLQKSEANVRTIFNNTDTGYVLLDKELNVLSFNDPVNEFAKGHLGKEIIEGTPAISYFSAEKRGIIETCLQNALDGNNSNYEVCYKLPDEHEQWYYAAYHPVWNNNKKVLGVIMSITDITERKISELQEKTITEDLLQRNKALEQFTYIVSHNLRAPVASVKGVANALMEGNADEQDTKVYLEGLSASIQRLDTVIVDLNNILQVKHKINEHKEKVSFTQVVNDIKFHVSNFTDSEMIMILNDFSEIDEMSTLKSYIHSIFYNLISNSIKYRRPGVAPVIDIKSRKHGNRIEITFKDNSMGIDMEKKKDQVFGLYNRFHPQSAEGKGIGLFMVKTQVETLGGRISVSSRVNEGTEFKIEFRED